MRRPPLPLLSVEVMCLLLGLVGAVMPGILLVSGGVGIERFRIILILRSRPIHVRISWYKRESRVIIYVVKIHMIVSCFLLHLLFNSKTLDLPTCNKVGCLELAFFTILQIDLTPSRALSAALFKNFSKKCWDPKGSKWILEHRERHFKRQETRILE